MSIRRRPGPTPTSFATASPCCASAGWSSRGRTPPRTDGAGCYLHEALVTGRCPHCGEGSDGNACEACGRPNACVDLADAVATVSGEPIAVAPVERLHFRLSALAAELETYVKDLPPMPAARLRHIAASDPAFA